MQPRAESSSLFELRYPNRRVLHLINSLHLIESVALMLVLAGCAVLQLALPYPVLWGIIAVYLSWIILLRWMSARRAAEADCTVLVTLSLVVELLLLSAIFGVSGGAGNPFVSLFLVAPTMAALTLNGALTALVSLLSAVCYTGLLWWQPDAHVNHMGGGASSQHVVGMWLNFLVCEALLVGFLFRMSEAARERSQRLAALRESRARDERLVAMAGVAAGAAHSLGTPLSTIDMVLDELAESATPAEAPLLKDARGQLEVCRERLREILLATQSGQAGALARPLDQWVRDVARSWHRLHPEADLILEQDVPATIVTLDPAVEHGLLTLLDNAIEADLQHNHSRVTLKVSLANAWLRLAVEDCGGGPVPRLDHDPGNSDKPYGAGRGLMILRANLDRLQGQLAFEMGRHGVIAVMTVPVADVPE